MNVDLARAKQLLCWSGLAYEYGIDAIQGSSWLAGSCADLSTIQQFTLGIDSCLVGSMLDGSGSVVAFRGTVENNVRDWMNDSDCVLVQSAHFDGRVHLGFEDSLQHLWMKTDFWRVVSKLTDLQWITGHSKAGALGSLLCLLRAGATLPRVFSFGSPMPGDDVFAASFNRLFTQYRFENRNDIVAHLPTRCPLVGLSMTQPVDQYEAVGTLCYLDGIGGCHEGDSLELAAYRDAKLLVAGESLAEDHYLSSYLAAIEAAQTE